MFPIPTVMTAQELLDVALRRAAKATGPGGRTRLERARKASVSKIQTLGDTIEAKLRSYVDAVPSLERLPAFQRDLVDAVVGIGRVKHDLGAIDWCRDQVKRVCRQASRSAGRAATPEEAQRARKAVYGRVSSLLRQIAPNLNSFAEARGRLLRIPDIDADMPAIVVAGSPNVGKSQFVRTVSSGRPKVAPYPFTTQGISVGHVDRDRRRYLIVDTPGLLDRPMEDRNEVERQAIIALRHLADVIVFLFDPSETCGFPMSTQEGLLRDLRAAFPAVPFVEVENKVDLVRTASPRPKVSASSGKGCAPLLERTLELVPAGPGDGALERDPTRPRPKV